MDDAAVTSQPVFSPFLFWDSDLEQLDFQRDASYVIRRVFDIGTLEDVAEAMRFYSREKLVQSLTSAHYLPENAMRLAAVLFELKPQDFKCYSSKQYHPLS